MSSGHTHEETLNESDTCMISSVLQSPLSYLIVLIITFTYSIILVIIEWNSTCYGTSASFKWQYYLLTTIGLMILYRIYLQSLSTNYCIKQLLKSICGLSIRIFFGNVLFPFCWCIYGLIDWIILFKQCNNTIVIISYLIILILYTIVCFILSIRQCSNGFNFNQREQQNAEIETKEDKLDNIPLEKIGQFVEQLEYFDNLDFSTSTVIGSTSHIQSNAANTLSPMPTLDETKTQDVEERQLSVPPSFGGSSSKSFGNLFLGDAKEMSSAMFLNYNKENGSDANLMCMVCLEPFVAHDKIGKLMCNHIFLVRMCCVCSCVCVCLDCLLCIYTEKTNTLHLVAIPYTHLELTLRTLK